MHKGIKYIFLLIVLLIPSHAWATFSVVQSVFNNSCGAVTSCSITVSAIGAGHLGVVLIHNGNTSTLSSVTAAGETFSLLVAGGTSCHFQGGGNTTDMGCAYTLKTVGGAITVTCNWSGTTGASNTSCGFYEIAYTTNCGAEPSIFLESNVTNGQDTSASTNLLGVDFTASYPKFINGSNDIIFQLTNVSTGTVSSINTSFVLDNNTGQVADAHRLNTFDMTVPTWTNSVSATALVSAISFGENFCSPLTTFPNSPTGLSAIYSGAQGSSGTQTLAITSAGLFELVFDNADNWGIDGWYDLVNDPTLTTNLLSPACPVGTGNACTLPGSLNSAEPGLFQRTYYDFGDVKQYGKPSHAYFPNMSRSLNVLEYNPSRIVVETKSMPAATASTIFNNLTGTTRYYIYPNGQIYVHHVATVTNAATIATTGTPIFSDVTLEDPTQLGTTPPDSIGWIRATASGNPWSGSGPVDPYIFAYWGPGTTGTYQFYTKASIMLVRSPNNLYDNSQIIHSWQSGTGYGVVRWGWSTNNAIIALGAGGTETEDMLIQLGTQGSTVLPNITSSTVAGPIATAYINNPTPPPVQDVSPSVNVNTTSQFTTNDSGGTYACANTSNGGTCLGSVNSSTGLYTAPASLIAPQSLGGYPLRPNDDVFNVNISGLSAASNSATIMAAVGSVPVNFLPSFPINYVTPSTTTTSMVFKSTPNNNGTFQTPVWPLANVENGWWDSLVGNTTSDHHIRMIDTTTGNLTEIYQWFAQAPVPSCTVNGSNSATCTITSTNTSAGFVRAAALGKSVLLTGWTSGDTYLNGTFTLTSATSTSITFNISHATASTTTSGSASLITSCVLATCNAVSGMQYLNTDYGLPVNGSVDAAGLPLSPLTLNAQEVVNAVANGTAITHALRMTLQNGFICGSSTASACPVGSVSNAAGTRHIWPATSEAFAGGGIVPYGTRFRLKSAFNISSFSAGAQVLLTQMKNYGLILADGGGGWQITSDFDNLPASAAAVMQEINNANIATSNWEVVDESSLMETTLSGATTTGEIVTYTQSSGSASANVGLMGTAVNVGTQQFYIMAGTPAQQLPYYSNGAVTCTMSPTVGSITSGCLYTPPGSEASVTTTTVTVTSNANGSVKAQMTVYVTPAVIRLLQATSDYTDSLTHVWYSSNHYGVGMSNVPSWPGCCNNNSSITGTDKQLFWNHLLNTAGTRNDYKMDIHLPNGVYQIVFNNGTYLTLGQDVRNFYVQGALAATIDSVAVAGTNAQWFQTFSATVINNVLSFYNTGIGQQAKDSGDVSSISISQTSSNIPTAPIKAGVLLSEKQAPDNWILTQSGN
jgi:hypothetical protein